jgi:hypothetical protein
MRQTRLALVLLIIAVATPLFAASLSELDVKGFQQRTVPATKAIENPFMKQNVSMKDVMIEDLNLNGIVYSPADSYALVSGFVVKEGDEIGGYKVKLIERDHVILKQLDQVKVLRLE